MIYLRKLVCGFGVFGVVFLGLSSGVMARSLPVTYDIIGGVPVKWVYFCERITGGTLTGLLLGSQGKTQACTRMVELQAKANEFSMNYDIRRQYKWVKPRVFRRSREHEGYQFIETDNKCGISFHPRPYVHKVNEEYAQIALAKIKCGRRASKYDLIIDVRYNWSTVLDTIYNGLSTKASEALIKILPSQE